MKTRPSSTRPLRSEITRAVATLRSDPGLLGMKLRQRWQQRRHEAAPVPGAPPRPKIASIDQDLAAVAGQLRERGVRTGVVYGDAEFRDALTGATPEITWDWVSHRDSDVLAGAALPATKDIAAFDALVVGGADVKTAYLNALRWVERADKVTPVYWVGQGFEYCGSTIPIPAEVEVRGHLSLSPLCGLLPDQGPAARPGDEHRCAQPPRALPDDASAGDSALHARRPPS